MMWWCETFAAVEFALITITDRDYKLFPVNCKPFQRIKFTF